MDIKNIKKLIDLMKANDLSEFEIEEEGFRLAIKRKNGAEQVMLNPSSAQTMMMAPTPVATAAAPAAVPAAAPEEAGKKLLEVKSPIVGTLYRSPAPDADPFVSVGQEIEEDTVVCVIEAMKVMNEIKAEVKGVVRKVLVDNATPVQFGQVLFLVEPA